VIMAEAATEAKDRSSKQTRISFTDIPEFHEASTLEPVGNRLSESFRVRPRPRSLSHHLSSKKIPSRRWLKVQARFWRCLMSLGMQFHDFAYPRPPKPTFTHKIPTDTVPIELFFYLPPIYHSCLHANPSYHFPVVVNFHGGGFVLGDATDDRYWARVVTSYTHSIFVSVNYRRAPEYPFPVPVDDCVEALVYLWEHSDTLHIDPSNVALSGFSAGANLAFSVPLRLLYHRRVHATVGGAKSDVLAHIGTNHGDDSSEYAVEEGDDQDGDHDHDHDHDHHDHLDSYSYHSHNDPNFATPHQSTSNLLPGGASSGLIIRTIVAWYPLLDWTMSRPRKIRESRNPKKCLPKTFTDLFDFSYLPPPDVNGHHRSPYASPGLAPDHMILDGLPRDIQMWLCEWDMLLREGQAFAERLDKLGKNIKSRSIPRVPHGWDKSPNPFRDQAAIDILYQKAATGLRDVFEHPEIGLRGNGASSLYDVEDVIERQPRISMIPM